MNFCFKAYNIEFISDFEPPCEQGYYYRSGSPDVLILNGACPNKVENVIVETDFCKISSVELLLNVENVARYYVQEGKKITVEPYPDVDIDKVRLFLYGSALGALLYQRGLFPIHGAAVNTVYGVMIFVGEQGAGKSTLAAHFQKNGYSLLSDDVCAVTRNKNGILIVLPAFAQIRLCTDALEKLGSLSCYPTARFDVDKFVVSLQDCYDMDSSPLSAVHLLSNVQDEKIHLKRMSGFDRLNLLIDNLYRPFYLTGLASMPAIMRLATTIASEVEIIEIQRPRDFSRISELIEMLEKFWAQKSNFNKKE